MPVPDRRLLRALSLVAIPAVLLLCAVVWPPAVPLGVPPLWGAARAERLRGERIDRELAAVGRSIRHKQEVARGLVEGRLTLLQAARRCRDLDRGRADFKWDFFRSGVPGGSDDERHCREAIELVRWSPLRSRAAAEQIARHLEAELQAHLDGGTLQLPAADAWPGVSVRVLPVSDPQALPDHLPPADDRATPRL